MSSGLGDDLEDRFRGRRATVSNADVTIEGEVEEIRDGQECDVLLRDVVDPDTGETSEAAFVGAVTSIVAVDAEGDPPEPTERRSVGVPEDGWDPTERERVEWDEEASAAQEDVMDPVSEAEAEFRDRMDEAASDPDVDEGEVYAEEIGLVDVEGDQETEIGEDPDEADERHLPEHVVEAPEAGQRDEPDEQESAESPDVLDTYDVREYSGARTLVVGAAAVNHLDSHRVTVRDLDGRHELVGGDSDEWPSYAVSGSTLQIGAKGLDLLGLDVGDEVRAIADGDVVRLEPVDGPADEGDVRGSGTASEAEDPQTDDGEETEDDDSEPVDETQPASEQDEHEETEAADEEDAGGGESLDDEESDGEHNTDYCCGAPLDDTLEYAVHQTEDHGKTRSELDFLEPGEFEEIVEAADDVQDVADAVGFSTERVLRMLGIYGLAEAVGPGDVELSDINEVEFDGVVDDQDPVDDEEFWCGYCGEGPLASEEDVRRHHRDEDHPGKPVVKTEDPTTGEEADQGDTDPPPVSRSDGGAAATGGASRTCQNCGNIVSAQYAKVHTPEDQEDVGPLVCPQCPDKIRDGNDVREARSGRRNGGSS